MKKQSYRKLGDLLQEYFTDIGRNQGILSARVVRSWDEVAGKQAAAGTVSKFFKDGVLYVNINSSILRTNLSYRKKQIISEINTRLGGSFVKSIVLR